MFALGGRLARFARGGAALSLAAALSLVAPFATPDGAAVAATSYSVAPCADANRAGDASGFSMDCQVLGAKNDSPLELNDEAAFGLGDWVFGGRAAWDDGWTYSSEAPGAGRAGVESADIGFGLAAGSNAKGGRWSIDASFWDEWSSLAVVFKSSNTVVMYLVTPDTLSGLYALPTSRDIGQVSVYASRSGGFDGEARAPQVPLPAAAPLLVGGLGMLGALTVAGRRRRAASGRAS